MAYGWGRCREGWTHTMFTIVVTKRLNDQNTVQQKQNAPPKRGGEQGMRAVNQGLGVLRFAGAGSSAGATNAVVDFSLNWWRPSGWAWSVRSPL